jgi:hypothetical protein
MILGMLLVISAMDDTTGRYLYIKLNTDEFASILLEVIYYIDDGPVN